MRAGRAWRRIAPDLVAATNLLPMKGLRSRRRGGPRRSARGPTASDARRSASRSA